MKPNKARVLALMSQEPARSWSFGAISKPLAVKKPQSGALKIVLDQLVEEGHIQPIKRGYRMAQAAKSGGASPRPDRNRPDRQAPQSASPPVEGRFMAHPRGFAFVDCDSPRRSYFIPPAKVGGALDGDRVRVAPYLDRRSGREAAAVEAVLERRRTRARGQVQVMRGREVWVVPFNEKLPPIYAGNTLPSGVQRGDTVEVKITDYPQDADMAPGGTILSLVEDGDSPQTIIANILADNQIEEEFPPEVDRELARVNRKITNAKERKDLSKFPFVTIDGEDAKDFDDAVCLIDEPEGRTRLLVAIADVAHYVKPGTALDRAAYDRGTSVYLPHRAIPMLPELLSNDLCSLRPGVPRHVLTCDMLFDRSGEMAECQIYEGVMHSHARLTYDQVQEWFETGHSKTITDSVIQDMLNRMREFAANLGVKRKARGALHLILPEIRFVLEPGGLPTALRLVYPSEATRLIEQFMLEANEAVAELASNNDLPVLYRVHDPPQPDRIEALQALLDRFGIQSTGSGLSSPGALVPILDQIEDHPQRDRIEMAVLRSMSLAQYRSSNDGHYGLAATFYTHFTSPIRRYPDLLLHRALKAWIRRRGSGKQEGGLDGGAGTHLSDCERAATEAERAVQRLFKVLVMEPFLGDSFPGRVSSIGNDGLWIELPDHHVEGWLPLESLPPNRYRRDKERDVLRGTGQPREIGAGDRLTVSLVRADRHAQTLEFAFGGWGWPSAPGEASKRKPGGSPKRKKGGKKR